MSDTNPHASDTDSPVPHGRLLSMLCARPVATLLAGLGIGALATFGVMSALQANESVPVRAPTIPAEETRTAAATSPTDSTATAPGSGPSVTLDSDTIDFGRIEQDTTVDHVLTVSNSGDADLVIREVRST